MDVDTRTRKRQWEEKIIHNFADVCLHGKRLRWCLFVFTIEVVEHVSKFHYARSNEPTAPHTSTYDGSSSFLLPHHSDCFWTLRKWKQPPRALLCVVGRLIMKSEFHFTWEFKFVVGRIVYSYWIRSWTHCNEISAMYVFTMLNCWNYGVAFACMDERNGECAAAWSGQVSSEAP